MCTRGTLALVAAVTLSSLGCAGYTHVNTVPWWKGLPLMVIEPTSLEAMVWRDHLRARHRNSDAPRAVAPQIADLPLEPYASDAPIEAPQFYGEPEWSNPADSDLSPSK